MLHIIRIDGNYWGINDVPLAAAMQRHCNGNPDYDALRASIRERRVRNPDEFTRWVIGQIAQHVGYIDFDTEGKPVPTGYYKTNF